MSCGLMPLGRWMYTRNRTDVTTVELLPPCRNLGCHLNDNRHDVNTRTEGRVSHFYRSFVPSSEWSQLILTPLLYPQGKREPVCLPGCFSSTYA
ncbi:hypothetical protein AVEN_69868-1 [Araneus ventricosus]|uniref:Uncharacterized protein n=1 Tax=Araneus ventricosus TaxID=182803 RepID=A0A4Y2HEZ2_ARAVE|nr:hypothetical protein AVEN_69868-1 [Araneus ventricosus]